MKNQFGQNGDVVSIDELMKLAADIDKHNAEVLGCTVEDLDTDTIPPYIQADVDFCMVALSKYPTEVIEVDAITEDEEDDFICGTHGVSLHLHECEGFDF